VVEGNEIGTDVMVSRLLWRCGVVNGEEREDGGEGLEGDMADEEGGVGYAAYEWISLAGSWIGAWLTDSRG